MKTFVLAVIAGLSLTSFTGCPQPTGCNSTTCQGCCDQRGVCQMGVTTTSCGARGTLCTECGAGLSCSSGACAFGSSGGGASGTGGGLVAGGGMGGAAAGGGSAGGIGRVDQELVSGTRLRAVNYVGSDGSRAPAFFWDSQLNTLCSPGFANGVAACLPLRVASTLVVAAGSGFFSDPTCQQALFIDFGTAQLYADVPLAQVFGSETASTDGGAITTYHSVSPITTFYGRASDGGCVVTTNALIRAPYASTGVVPLSSFATMPRVRE